MSQLPEYLMVYPRDSLSSLDVNLTSRRLVLLLKFTWGNFVSGCALMEVYVKLAEGEDR